MKQDIQSIIRVNSFVFIIHWFTRIIIFILVVIIYTVILSGFLQISSQVNKNFIQLMEFYYKISLFKQRSIYLGEVARESHTLFSGRDKEWRNLIWIAKWWWKNSERKSIFFFFYFLLFRFPVIRIQSISWVYKVFWNLESDSTSATISTNAAQNTKD